jgi:Caudovirus prohead protease.
MSDTITKEFTTGYVRQIDESRRMAEFVISDASEDRHGTVLNMENFKLDNYRKNPIVLYQHMGYGGSDSDPDDVIGRSEVFMEGSGSDMKLIGRAYFEPSDVNEKADKIFKKIQQGTLRATSVGFMPLEDQSGRVGQFGKLDEAGQPNEYRHLLLQWTGAVGV